MPSEPNPGTDLTRATLLAMLGDIEEGFRLGREAARRLTDLHGDAAGIAWLAEIFALAGDQAAAVEEMSSFCNRLERRGRVGNLSYYAPRLGRMLCALGRYDEAAPLAQRGRELTPPGDRIAETAWRQTQALVDSHRGLHAEAETLAREAIEIAEQTDSLNLQGDAYTDLAEVLANANKKTEAIASLEKAVNRYERKRTSPCSRRHANDSRRSTANSEHLGCSDGSVTALRSPPIAVVCPSCHSQNPQILDTWESDEVRLLPKTCQRRIPLQQLRLICKHECAICRRFLMGAAGIEPATPAWVGYPPGTS